jgi:glutathione S-transferase
MPGQLPVLYSFRRCPYAIRARLALRYAGIAIDLREVALKQKPAEMLAISPKGTVPVLLLPDGRVLEESLDIMRWAVGQHDPDGWLTQAPPHTTDALIQATDLHFKPLLDRYKYPERHPGRTQPSWRDQAVDEFLLPLEGHLAAHRYLLGDHPCLADMAILPFVRQFAQVDRSWWEGCDKLKGLRAWLDGLVRSALFDAVMSKT